VVVNIIKPSSIFGCAKYELLNDEVILGIKVKKGFITDGATVPRLMWPLFPPISVYLEATVLHDYLLTHGINRYRCDCLFKRAMKAYGARNWVASAMFMGVVMFGFIKKHDDYFKIHIV